MLPWYRARTAPSCTPSAVTSASLPWMVSTGTAPCPALRRVRLVVRLSARVLLCWNRTSLARPCRSTGGAQSTDPSRPVALPDVHEPAAPGVGEGDVEPQAVSLPAYHRTARDGVDGDVVPRSAWGAASVCPFHAQPAGKRPLCELAGHDPQHCPG